MVSTRGIRYKFSEGERVLCYEPDPTKAKVLYDSKVLEVIDGKDKRGRRTVEYLIHFQGWNSSWDRCVSEDFVLKDTEENRQLQRDLAEKSQLQLGAYLYRRERKKGSTSTSGGGPAKRTRQGFSDDGSSTSTQPDVYNNNESSEPLENVEEEENADSEADGEMDVEGESEDGEEGASGSDGSSDSSSPSPNAWGGRAHIPLPPALRDRLTFDYHLVVKRGCVTRLPAVPCAAHILESFVKWFARAGAWHQPRARHDPPARPDLLDISRRLNLVREVADGLRVYFDFILRSHLLYKQERVQYQQVCGTFPHKPDEVKRTDSEDDENESEEEDAVPLAETADEDLKSPKIPEYAHLPPDPVEGEKSDGEVAALQTENGESEDKKNCIDDKSDAKSDSAPEDMQNGNNDSTDDKSNDEKIATRPGNVARRLRSHKSIVSQSESEEPAPSTSTAEPKAFETFSSSVGSSGSSVSESWSRAPGPPPAPATPQRSPLSQLFDKVAKWKLIPREGTEYLPCRIYGAVHLARLFVKLPEFLSVTQMSDAKLKLILQQVELFVQFLDEHSEWFGEKYYVTNNDNTRSH